MDNGSHEHKYFSGGTRASIRSLFIGAITIQPSVESEEDKTPCVARVAFAPIPSLALTGWLSVARRPSSNSDFPSTKVLDCGPLWQTIFGASGIFIATTCFAKLPSFAPANSPALQVYGKAFLKVSAVAVFFRHTDSEVSQQDVVMIEGNW